eukprot:243101-Ditylum_brightwellii.AAC.1
MPKSQNEKEEIVKTMAKIRSQMQKPTFNHPVCVKGNILIHAHLLRKTDELSEGLKADLKYMLKVSTSLIDAMISVCKHKGCMQTALNCISFGQYAAQAWWTKDNPLLQLPYFTTEEVKHCSKGKSSQNAPRLSEYFKIEDDKKRGVADFSSDQKKDIFKCCSLMPNLAVETNVFVDDDEDDRVYEGDLCTVK